MTMSTPSAPWISPSSRDEELALARLGGARTLDLYQDWSNQWASEVKLENLGHLGQIIRTSATWSAKNNVSSVEEKNTMTSSARKENEGELKKRPRAERKAHPKSARH